MNKEEEIVDNLKKELATAITKCKRLQKEKRALEATAECGRAHIEAGMAFDGEHRAYGTKVAMSRLREILDIPESKE